MGKNAILLELPFKGDLLRLEVVDYRGRRYCNFRRWVAADGAWKATAKGVTFPVELLPAFQEAVSEFLDTTALIAT